MACHPCYLWTSFSVFLPKRGIHVGGCKWMRSLQIAHWNEETSSSSKKKVETAQNAILKMLCSEGEGGEIRSEWALYWNTSEWVKQKWASVRGAAGRRAQDGAREGVSGSDGRRVEPRGSPRPTRPPPLPRGSESAPAGAREEVSGSEALQPVPGWLLESPSRRARGSRQRRRRRRWDPSSGGFEGVSGGRRRATASAVGRWPRAVSTVAASLRGGEGGRWPARRTTTRTSSSWTTRRTCWSGSTWTSVTGSITTAQPHSGSDTRYIIWSEKIAWKSEKENFDGEV